MKKVPIIALGIFAALLAILYIGASWYFSTILVAGNVKAVTADEIAQAEADLAPAGIPLPEEVTIAADDVSLAGYFYDNPADAGCGMVILHGYSSIAYDMASFVPMFWNLGCEVITYDARGHGNSSEAYHTFGYYERQDASAVVDWLIAETGVAADHIGLLGVSYGAATSLQTLAERSDLAFVVADSSYQDYYTIVAYQGEAQYGTWLKPLIFGATNLAEWRADFELDDVSPKDTIVGSPIPVLLIHALEDSYTFASHSETIYANADHGRTQLQITDWGNGHGASRSTQPEQYEAIVYEFMDQYAPQFFSGR